MTSTCTGDYKRLRALIIKKVFTKMEPFELQPPVWGLIEKCCPPSELDEVKEVISPSLVDLSMDLFQEVRCRWLLKGANKKWCVLHALPGATYVRAYVQFDVMIRG